MRLWVLSIQPGLNFFFSAGFERIGSSLRIVAKARPSGAAGHASEFCGYYVLVAA